MMKILSGFLLLILIGFVSGAYSIPKPEPVSTGEIVSGVIDKVDVQSQVMVVTAAISREKRTLIFDVTNKTRIKRSNVAQHIGDLKRMMQVRVEYKKESGRLSALSIEVLDR